MRTLYFTLGKMEIEDFLVRSQGEISSGSWQILGNIKDYHRINSIVKRFQFNFSLQMNCVGIMSGGRTTQNAVSM